MLLTDKDISKDLAQWRKRTQYTEIAELYRKLSDSQKACDALRDSVAKLQEENNKLRTRMLTITGGEDETHRIEYLISIYDCPSPIEWLLDYREIEPKTHGVYILRKNREISYVGTSRDMRRRIETHKLRSGYPFDNVGIIKVTGVLREALEVAMIGMLHPRYNRSWNPNSD